MNDFYTCPSLNPLWSALRYPSTGWVSEMLVRQMNRTIACQRDAGNQPGPPGRGRRIPVTIEVRSAAAARPRDVCCAADG